MDARAALALGLVACSVAGAGDPYFGRVPEPDPSHFTWCNFGEPEYLDPGRASALPDLKVVDELFDGLTTFDPGGLPLPSLATSWEIAPDLRRFTFHLRADARWSDGTPITAADFVYSIARVLHPLTASMNAEGLWKLRHGRAYSKGTARVVLADAPPFRAGDAVESLDADAPSPNLRVTTAPTPLRASPDPGGAVWRTAPAGAELTIIERSPGWAYVAWPAAGDEGAFGWVALDGLAAPGADRPYHVRSLDGGAEGTVTGKDLLMLPDLLGVHAPDAHTLVLETEGPTPYLLNLTLKQAFRPVPRQAVSRWPRTWTRPDRIVTSGPFRLTAWRPRDQLELERSPTFWDAAHVRLARATILSMDDVAANANVYFQGGCDAVVANGVPGGFLPALAGKKDLHQSPFLAVYYYLINVDRYRNVHLRRALAHALDRARLPAFLKGGQIPTTQFVPGTPIAEFSDADLALCGVTRATPGVALIVVAGKACYVPPAGPGYDEAAARRELELARAELGAAFPTRLGIRINSGVETNKTIAEWAQAEWRRVLGLDVEIEAQDLRAFLKATAEHDYDVARMAWLGGFADPENEFLSTFRCHAPDNRSGYCDPEFDRLLAEAETVADRPARLALVRRAEALMADAAPVVPLYVYSQYTLIKPYVRDLFVNLTDRQSLRATWIDPAWR